MLTEHCFNTGIVTLNYAEGASSGPPLVLLHGGSARWQSVLPLLPELSQHWHIYAPDLRGHGKSGSVPGGYRLLDYTADIEAFLKQVVKEPAVLFGHSLGGHIALLARAGRSSSFSRGDRPRAQRDSDQCGGTTRSCACSQPLWRRAPLVSGDGRKPSAQ